jgi:hypothetical protein
VRRSINLQLLTQPIFFVIAFVTGVADLSGALQLFSIQPTDHVDPITDEVRTLFGNTEVLDSGDYLGRANRSVCN